MGGLASGMGDPDTGEEDGGVSVIGDPTALGGGLEREMCLGLCPLSWRV